MDILLSIVHIITAALLIFLVLIQDSKGAMGGMLGGGGSNTLLGATGATSLLVKITRYVAVFFAVTCISLTIMSSKKTTSVVDDYLPAAAPVAAPAETAAPAPETAAPQKTETPGTDSKK